MYMCVYVYVCVLGLTGGETCGSTSGSIPCPPPSFAGNLWVEGPGRWRSSEAIAGKRAEPGTRRDSLSPAGVRVCPASASWQDTCVSLYDFALNKTREEFKMRNEAGDGGGWLGVINDESLLPQQGGQTKGPRSSSPSIPALCSDSRRL